MNTQETKQYLTALYKSLLTLNVSLDTENPNESLAYSITTISMLSIESMIQKIETNNLPDIYNYLIDLLDVFQSINISIKQSKLVYLRLHKVINLITEQV